MTKICIVSDLHFEIGGYPTGKQHQFTEDGDVLIVAGDLIPAVYLRPKATDAKSRSIRRCFDKFVDKDCSRFNTVLWVMGNHEHYDGVFGNTAEIIRSYTRDTNIVLLDNECYRYNDLTFIGSTLWTSYNRNDPLEKLKIEQGMNDYVYINQIDPQAVPYTDRHSGNRSRALGRLTTDYIYQQHELSVHFLLESFQKHKESSKVVITHHAPSFRSQDFKTRGLGLMHAFCSDLDHLVEQSDAKLWVHGHTHDNVDYMIGNTRVIANHRGYAGYEQCAKDYKPTYINL